MTPKKLSDSDKKEILRLYRTSEETTSTLAGRYGVSSSTISRFLKGQLSESEYESLIQQKRLARTPSRDETSSLPTPRQLELPESDSSDRQTPSLIRKKPQRLAASSRTPPVIKGEKLLIPEQPGFVKGNGEVFEESKEIDRLDVLALEEMLGEDLTDLEEDEEDLEDMEEEDWEDELEVPKPQIYSKNAAVQVLPLSEASFPKTCYLVIDRAAELITRPLKEFADLGKIPAAEVQQKTLPVFDNQRVARRFSNRSQRVIKVPDGRMLKKTCPYLQAKGITRLLMDGQVYSLSSY